MKIECVLHREGGTTVDIGGHEYHFKPQADGKHVSEVGDKAHARMLLDIPEAYRQISGKKLAKEEEPSADAGNDDPVGLIGSAIMPDYVDVKGEDVALAVIVRGAFEASGLTEAEWNALDGDERDAKLLDHIDLLNADDTTQAVNQPALAELTPAQKRAATMAAKKAVSEEVGE